MAFRKNEFQDLRVIVCMQGYPLDYQYYIREIGFWSRNLCGSIPLNCKINKNELDFYNQQTLYYFEEEIHGIKLKKHYENGLPSSDLKTILKCLYHLTKSDDYDASYIGVCKDEKISGILSRANLGRYVVEIDSLDLFKRMNIQFPNNDMIRKELTDKIESFPICEIHESLKNNMIPICSKAKAKFIANYCMQTAENEKILIKNMNNIENNNHIKV